MSISIEELTGIVKDTLNQNKGDDIVVFDVGDRAAIAKYMIIASSESSRHVKALAEYVVKSLKQYGKINVEGMQEGNWVVVGFHDIMIHIFRSDVREYYQIDQLWNNEKSIN